MKTAIEYTQGIFDELKRAEFGGAWAFHLIRSTITDAVEAEREACALAAEAQGTWVHNKPYEVQVDMRARIAAAIRARSVAPVTQDQNPNSTD